MDVSDLFGECMILRGGQPSYLDTWRGEWGGFGCEMVSSVMSLALYPSLFTVGVGVDVLSRVFVSTCLEAWCVGGDADAAGGLSIGHVSTGRLEILGYLVFLYHWKVGRRSSNVLAGSTAGSSVPCRKGEDVL
ncbi:unnamed protein product [Taenia asiatica]|uniref:Uncharacterized protein n=1 Tax=Taenia asiatica TaxID=60517 RepID=A0A0R3WE78_TAEAS|nr:unnamed protein product [Taenia asiatica]